MFKCLFLQEARGELAHTVLADLQPGLQAPIGSPSGIYVQLHYTAPIHLFLKRLMQAGAAVFFKRQMQAGAAVSNHSS